MNFTKHSELRNQSHSVETMPAKNVNDIIYGCCTSIVVVNKTGICTLDVLKTISSSNVVMVLNLCSILKFWEHKAMNVLLFTSLEHQDEVQCNNQRVLYSMS